ncbi:tyrosine-type recombinase/integrase [Salinarimonas rosea]|uniref:tyrosine-type recombinase/integrase n=1 Tax=Salinarimonas rosea TaxID=552063 RepID=UPI00041D019E|nr:site-specific integrase [Salinarimonas rosea]
MPKALTVRAVESAKPSDARREIPDGGCAGLYLIVQPSGVKSWAVRYRSPVTGKPVKLTLKGVPPEALADARKAARDALAAVSEGRDPSAERSAARAATIAAARDTSDTVAVLLDRFLSTRPLRERTAAEYRRLAERLIKPALGSRKVQDVRRRDVIALLDGIAERAPISANRTLALVRVFYGWLASRDMVETSPVLGVKPPARETSRDRFLEDREIAALWSATGGMGYPMGPLVRVLLLTGQRREEVTGMRWEELDLDGGAPRWTLERSRTKNDTAHVVPLSPAVVEILRGLPRSTFAAENGAEKPSPFVFTTTGKTPVSGLSKAKDIAHREMTAALGAEPAPWRLHDLRRTASTLMARLGIPQEHVEAVLNHRTGKAGGVAGVYNRFSYADEKRRALAALAGLVAEITGNAPANVVALRRAGS